MAVEFEEETAESEPEEAEVEAEAEETEEIQQENLVHDFNTKEIEYLLNADN